MKPPVQPSLLGRASMGLVIILCLALAGPALAGEKSNSALANTFQAIAREIIAGIDGSRPSDAALVYLNQAYDYVRPKRLRIAVAPFEQDDIKIAKAVADEFNASLFAALLKISGGRHDLMARSHLKGLIDDMRQTGAWEAADGNPINALLANAGKVDVLVRGQIRVDGQWAVLRYGAVTMDGRVVAQTRPQRLKLSPDDAKITRDTTPLDRAIMLAARQLVNKAPGLEHLLLGGIRFEDSGAQPPFGRYVEGRLAGALQEVFANSISGGKLRVGPLQAHAGLKSGGAVAGKDLGDRQLAGDQGAHILSGTYWELPGSIELRLDLKGGDGSSVAWTGWITRQDNAGRRLRPKGNFGPLRDHDGMGPFAFQLTSNRGLNAAYRVGDTLQLLIRLDRKAWLYCFYRDAFGGMIQILPNPHFLSNFQKLAFKAGVLHTVPDADRFGFEFKISPPSGQELVKCFAVSRDVSSELPKILRGNSLAPLPDGTDLRLSPTFQKLPNAAVSEASFVVTVSRR